MGDGLCGGKKLEICGPGRVQSVGCVCVCVRVCVHPCAHLFVVCIVYTSGQVWILAPNQQDPFISSECKNWCYNSAYNIQFLYTHNIRHKTYIYIHITFDIRHIYIYIYT